MASFVGGQYKKLPAFHNGESLSNYDYKINCITNLQIKMKNTIFLIFFLLALMGCSKKVLVDKSVIDTKDSTKVEIVKIENLIKDAVITDSSEIVIINYNKPDSVGKQSIAQRIEVKKRQKAVINEKKEVVFKVDSVKVVKATEKRDIFEKKVSGMWQYLPIAALIVLIIIINLYVKWRK